MPGWRRDGKKDTRRDTGEGLAQGLEQGQAQAQTQQAPIHARMQQLVSEFQNTLDASSIALSPHG